MKLLIASDIHGDISAAEAVKHAFEKEKCDKILLLGDILYHGPRNDLPKNYAPKEVISLLNGIKDKILAVRGNCDTEVDQMVLEFPILADYLLIYDGKITVFATHGHIYNTSTPPTLAGINVLLHGHTHVHIAKELENGTCYINPGSAALPKEGQKKSYALYENGVFTVKAFDGSVLLERSFN